MSTDTLPETAATPFVIADDAADLLFREARTAREFTDAEVTDEELAAVYQLIAWGPTAMNTVPLRVLAVRSTEARERLAALMAEGNRQRVLDAPVTLVLAADPAFHTHLPVLAPHMAGMAEALEPAAAMRAQMARDNAFLQAGYLIVGLRAAGFSAGPMGLADPAGIDAAFFAETGWSSLMVVNVGRTEGTGTEFPRAARLTYSEASLTV
ncbi:malonic semialdehyde reductase [Cellulomonas sp. P22]|uniref:malonic semialdehyde reductase n=1 Tax=Cellulomonas sp. P22 TaxID=3373189 RepID=UPI0037B8E193